LLMTLFEIAISSSTFIISVMRFSLSPPKILAMSSSREI